MYFLVGIELTECENIFFKKPKQMDEAEWNKS